jgi:hypothetical protein
MVRRPDLTLTRPIPEDDMIALIESGEITAQDEIAPGNGYWFSIQEVDEVKIHFGDSIVLQSLMPTGHDTTSSTNTALITKGNNTKSLFNPKNVQIEEKNKPIAQKLSKVQTTQPSADTGSTSARLVFGFFLIFIFLGTLSLLWLGSR